MRRVSKLALSCLLVPALLAACSSKETNEKAPESGQNSSPSASASAGSENAKLVEVTMVREKSGAVKFRNGETMDKNAVSDAYEKELGIKIKNLWVADSSQYQQKLQMSISSNDIPDLMFVNADQFQQLIEADMLMDLNAVYEKTAAPETKKYLTGDGGLQMESAKRDGKLLAIPATNSPYNNASFLWVRKDWLDKLGLRQPKTMQDLLKVTEAFTKQDPGGTGKSYGLPLTKDTFVNGDAFAITGFFNGFHAYPGQWVKDASGKLVYGSVQPEMKAALKQLQEMYKGGQIDPEFAVKDMMKENELLASNKIGVAYGPFWLNGYPIQDGAVKDGKVVQDWVPYPIVSIDDKPAMTQIELGVDGYWVVSKKAKNPEAVIKLLNKWVQVVSKPTDEDKKTYLLNTEEAQSYWLLNPIRVFSQDQNVRNGEVLPKAIQNKDVSLVQDDADQLDRYNKVMKYLNGDLSQWGEWGYSGPGGSFSIMSSYLKDKRYHVNGYTGAPGPIATEKKPILETKMNEVFIKIIMNQLPIDEFDKFVEDWKKIGGDAMTEEVNKLYAKTAKK